VTLNSPPQDLQQFTDAVKVLGLVDEAQENIVDLFSNEGAQSQEFSVDTMKHSFEKVTFARIFRVEELQQLEKGKF
jgi:hypothetical protein